MLWLKGFMCGLIVLMALMWSFLLACGRSRVVLVATVSIHACLMLFDS